MRHGLPRLGALLLTCVVIHASGQQSVTVLDPVHWSAESSLPHLVHAGTHFNVLLHAAIDEGWHLYALPEPNAFPLATEVALASTDAADLLRVDEDKPHHSLDPETKVATAWFAQSATFNLRLSATGSQRPAGLQVMVRYQACNDRMCLPQRDTTVPVQLHPAR